MSTPKSLVLTACVALAVLSSAGRAQAQTIVTAQVPFEFSIGGDSYPAGAYTLDGGARSPFLLLLHGGKRDVSHLFVARRGDDVSGAESQLTFNRYGDHYFLAKVVIASEGISLTLEPSKAEREIRSRVAPTTTTLPVSH
jgi:hypothetical protein